ncbi:Rha family transcriptional regulator [Bacillus paranthracis]|uniref:Rha family transcriptional regulator n=1 Tax=Bacillus paranthracis TaxID=2026186 RepID=UPI002D773E15|nr:Rha family transcriptional regulator [Bacillus paranthracis]
MSYDSLEVVNGMDEKLVFQQGQSIVTDSLTIADVFGKRHSDVIRSIENLECSIEFTQRNFALSEYGDPSGKRNKKYFIKRDGATFLITSFTGKRAAAFKELFINEFARMEEFITKHQKNELSKAPTSREQFLATMRLGLQHEEDLSKLKTDVEQIKDDLNERMTVDYSQQQAIRGAVNRRVYCLWDNGTVNKSIHDTRKKVFASIWKDVKERFAVNSYHNVRQREFDEVIDYIKTWRPRLV